MIETTRNLVEAAGRLRSPRRCGCARNSRASGSRWSRVAATSARRSSASSSLRAERLGSGGFAERASDEALELREVTDAPEGQPWVACVSAEVTVMRMRGTSRWRASDSASGKYLSCGALAISIGAERRAADRSGESDRRRALSASGSAAKRPSKRAGSRLTSSAWVAAAAGPSDLQGVVAQTAQRIGGRRIETPYGSAECLRVGRRVEAPDERPCHADRQLGRHGVRLPSVRARIRSGRREHHDLLEVGEGSDAGDDRDPSRELGRGGGEKRERCSDRDADEADPPVAGLGRVGRRPPHTRRRRERRERELAGRDAR